MKINNTPVYTYEKAHTFLNELSHSCFQEGDVRVFNKAAKGSLKMDCSELKRVEFES